MTHQDQEDKRNFLRGVANGGLFSIGMAFLGTSTVVPAYVTAMGGSRLAVGIAAAIFVAGWPLPQLFVARYARRYERTIGFYWAGGIIRSICLLLAVISVFYARSMSSSAAVVLFLVGLSGFSLAGGVGGIAFTEMVARTVPSSRRSALFSQRALWGSIGSLIAGLAVRYLLAEENGLAFPLNYAVVFACAWVFTAVAIATYASVHEPALPPNPVKESFLVYLKSGISLLSGDQRYRKYLTAFSLASSHQMAIPFYSVFLLKRAGAGNEALLGLLIAAQTIGGIASNFVWARLGERHGSSAVFRSSIATTVLVPFLALAAGVYLQAGAGLTQVTVAGTILFAMMGIATTGSGIANLTYLLDISPVVHRTTYVGFTNTFSALYGLYPLIGGLAADRFDANLLFGFVFALQLAALITAWRLPLQVDATVGT